MIHLNGKSYKLYLFTWWVTDSVIDLPIQLTPATSMIYNGYDSSASRIEEVVLQSLGSSLILALTLGAATGWLTITVARYLARRRPATAIGTTIRITSYLCAALIICFFGSVVIGGRDPMPANNSLQSLASLGIAHTLATLVAGTVLAWRVKKTGPKYLS